MRDGLPSHVFTVLLLAAALACKTIDQPLGSAALDAPPTDETGFDTPAVVGDSFIERLAADGREMSRMPVLLPSQVWLRVVEQGGTTEAGHLLDKLLVRVLAGQDREFVNSVLTSGLGPAIGAIALLGPGTGIATEVEISALASRLLPIFTLNPKLLDVIATIDLTATGMIQANLYRRGSGTGDLTGVKPFVLPQPTPSIDFTAEGCPDPVDKFETVAELNAGALLNGRPSVRDDVAPCFQKTSAALATALNLLANNLLADDAHAFKIKVDPGSEPVTIRSYEELLDALRQGDYIVELFTTRVFVEFRSLVWKDSSGASSVRLNTWITDRMGLSPIRAPAEHGEIGFLIHRGGKRIAQTRWYAGLPDEEFAGQSAYWRPHPELSAPWSGLIHELVEVYDGDRPLAGAAQWFAAAAHLMNGYQAINAGFRPPYEAYGLLVCTDSLAAALAKLSDLRGAGQRLTQAFPIVRAQLQVGQGESATSLDAFFEKHSALTPRSLAALYPVDQVVARDGDAWKRRLATAFPKGPRYAHFPEFRSVLSTAVHD